MGGRDTVFLSSFQIANCLSHYVRQAVNAGLDAAAPADAHARRGPRRLGFFAICLAYCAIILDGSVLNVAIPTIRDRLGSSMAGAQWVLDAYTLPLARKAEAWAVLGQHLR